MVKKKIAPLSALVIVLGLGIPTAASTQDRSNISAIVDHFSPEFYPLRGETHKCFATFNSPDPKSRTSIVAAYADDQQGRLRLLMPSEKAYLVAYDMEIASADARSCSVELVDVDGDGINEVKITFASRRGGLTDWILKVRQNQLINLGPTSTDRNGRLRSLFSNSVLLDVRNNGTLQVISSEPEFFSGDHEGRDSLNRLYVFENGRYVPGELLLFHYAFGGYDAGADREIGGFTLPANLDGLFILLVADQAGKSAQDDSQGTISVNGLETVSHKSSRGLSVRLENLVVGTNQIAIKFDRNSEGSRNQDDTTGMLNVLVLGESPSK